MGRKVGLRFGASGDWRGELAPYPAISNVPARELDFFAVLGDTIYADFPSFAVPLEQATTLDDFRAKHDEVYSAVVNLNTLADLRASTSIYATIDDHEVIDDFSGAADVSSDERFSDDSIGTLINDSVLYNHGLQAFLEYNPIATMTYADTGSDPRMDGELKLYRQRTLGSDAIFITLDARSFRDTGLPAVSNPFDPAQVAEYLVTSLSEDRTMLGKRQLDDLKADLLDAQKKDITWKFVSVPEPAQNLGVVGASDRFEGYARERTDILKFITDNDIENVVFITADIHGTVINNLGYQELTATGIQHMPTSVFEISTGSVAYDKPFGSNALELLAQNALISPSANMILESFLASIGVPLASFESWPLGLRDAAIKGLINGQIVPLGYSPVGLEDSELDVTLLQGSYSATHTFGWSEFEVDADTQNLTVTTYGIEAYSEADLGFSTNKIFEVISREPQVISQFMVRPKGVVFEQCATYDQQTLEVLCTNVGENQFSGQMSVIQTYPLPLQLELTDIQQLELDEKLPGCATFIAETNMLELPCVRVGEQQFWANLELLPINNELLTFELKDFGLRN